MDILLSNSAKAGTLVPPFPVAKVSGNLFCHETYHSLLGIIVGPASRELKTMPIQPPYSVIS